jgi:hypothetical protein
MVLIATKPRVSWPRKTTPGLVSRRLTEVGPIRSPVSLKLARRLVAPVLAARLGQVIRLEHVDDHVDGQVWPRSIRGSDQHVCLEKATEAGS